MNFLKIIVPVSVVILTLGCASPPDADPLVASLDSIMTSVVDTARFNGNILFARNGKIVYQKSFGWANFNTQESLNDSSLFDLASLSKQFTATAIMMLKEQGKLSYEDDVRKYIPELPYDGMTIRHFLNHTSGIPGYMDRDINMGIGWSGDTIAFNDDVIAALAKFKPAPYFKPGERWAYSNTGYVLLATIISRVSGKPYGEFLEKNIFAPLGMNRTRTYNLHRPHAPLISNYAIGFVYSDSLTRFILPDSLPGNYIMYTVAGVEGDGSVNSTTTDLFKWNEALYTDKIVTRAALEEAFTPARLTDGSTYPYGFGWRIANDSIHGKVVFHSGGWPGYYTHIRRYLDSKDCLILLTNNGGPGRFTVFGEFEKRLNRE